MAFIAKLRLASRVVRVTGWVHFLGLFLLGWARSGALACPDAALGLVASALYLAFTFGVNNLYDRDMDPASKNPFAAGEVPPGKGAAAMAALSLTSVLLAFAASPAMGRLFVFLNLVSYAYSGPLRLKRFPWWGSFHNVLIFGPLFLAGRLSGGMPAPADFFWTALFSITVLVVQVAQELADRPGDAAAGIRTTAIALGEGGSLRFMAWLAAGRAILAALLWVAGAAGLFTLAACLATGLAEAAVEAYYMRVKEFARMRMALRFVNMAFGFAMLAHFFAKG